LLRGEFFSQDAECQLLGGTYPSGICAPSPKK
jgi:hypothetical protein